jgi:hypothetical protein
MINNKELLQKALNNENNESIIDLTTQKIKQMNLNILKELHLDKKITLDYLKKLTGYRYIDDLNDIKSGAYVRWIPILDPENLPLHAGALISEIKIMDTGIVIVCKNFMHKYFQIKMDENLIFQKLSSQELILLAALDHLSN